MHMHRRFMTHALTRQTAGGDSSRDGSGKTTPKPARSRRGSATTRAHPFHTVAGLLSTLLLLVGGCASLNVDSKDLVLAVKFDNDDWGKPDDFTHGRSEQSGWPHILLKMKLKGSETGSILSIRSRKMSHSEKTLRKQLIRENGVPGAHKLEVRPFKHPRKIGGRDAYGYSYFENDFKRWAQVWYVDCPAGYFCEVYVESPVEAERLDPQITKVLDDIRWTRRHITDSTTY